MIESCFSFGRDIHWPCLSLAKAYIENGWSSISMAFGLLGCQPPLSRANDSGVFIFTDNILSAKYNVNSYFTPCAFFSV